MTRAVDTSIAIAAMLADHVSHETAEEALGHSTETIAHVALEAYSVLTRLPGAMRLDATNAATIVDARLPPSRLTLSADAARLALGELADAGVSGGAAYDGLIALTAREHDLGLISLDRRATRAYRALGVRFELLDG